MQQASVDEVEQLKKVLETALLTSPEPLSVPDLAKLFSNEIGTDVIRRMLDDLRNDWQGRGVATAMLDRLAERARAEGVRRFSADILAENRPMLDLIGELGDAHVIERDQGTVTVVVELPPEGIGAALREALRAAARDLLRVPHLLAREQQP